jgi:hypothetical protein
MKGTRSESSAAETSSEVVNTVVVAAFVKTSQHSPTTYLIYSLQGPVKYKRVCFVGDRKE